MTECRRCGNCSHYCIKNRVDRKAASRAYCNAFSLPIYSEVGYIVDMKYRYGEVNSNGLCDKWEKKHE